MITENNRWSVDCDQCLEDMDTSSFECDGPICDEEELIDYIQNYTDWIVDDDGNIFCCEDCQREWIEENKEQTK